MAYHETKQAFLYHPTQLVVRTAIGIFTELLDLASCDLFIFSELNNCYVLLQQSCVESVHIAEQCCNIFYMLTSLLNNFSFIGVG
jgi:hypothetical protein